MTGYLHMEMTGDKALHVRTHLEDVGMMDKAQLLHAFCTGLNLQASEVLLLLRLIDKIKDDLRITDAAGNEV